MAVRSLVAINEPALHFIVGTLIHHFFREKEELEERRENTPQRLQECSLKYEELMRAYCRDILTTRDARIAQFAHREGADGLRALQLAGALSPPWLGLHDTRGAALELEGNLAASRPMRQAELFDRVLTHVKTHKTLLARVPPDAFALGGLAHVIPAAEAVALRQGKALVLDPSPALLPPEQMLEAMHDLLACVKGGYGMPSQNSCNLGSYHAWLPLDDPRPRPRRPGSDAAAAAAADGLVDDDEPYATTELGPASRLLLRKLAALPALVAPHYPRQLAVPPLIQLGYFPPDDGAFYRPHLDRWPHETRNKRELTFLLYVNVDWDSERCGGCLRIHPSEPRNPALPLAPSTPLEVDPIAGRLVIFQAGECMHEVLPSRHEGRLALTLWVEREED